MIKEEYLEEVESIHKLDKNAKFRKKMDEAYELSNNITKLNDVQKERAQVLVRELLEFFFVDEFSESYSVPIEFIESDIGKMLFGLKFGVPEREYTATEVTAIMDITRALISYDRKHVDLLGKGSSRGKMTVLTEVELIQYMKNKGMTSEEVNEKISMFRKLRLEGVENEQIKIKIRDYIKKKYNIDRISK